MFKLFPYLIFAVLHLFCSVSSFANKSNPAVKVGIEEHLGQQIPLDLSFINSNGDTVLLRNIINKPTLLSFVYFHCSGICNPMQNALAEGIAKLKMKAGEDFRIITVCFDPKGTRQDAAKWKKDYIEVLSDHIPGSAWYVLTGDSISTKKLTDAVGFYYKADGYGNFIHAGSVYAISPKGTITRYLYFDQFYNPFDLKMALLEADQNQANPTVKTVLQYCFSYDPQGKRYVFNTTRVIGTFMIIVAGSFFTFLVIKSKKQRKNNLTKGI